MSALNADGVLLLLCGKAIKTFKDLSVCCELLKFNDTKNKLKV